MVALERSALPVDAPPPLKPTLAHKLVYSLGQFAQTGGFETALGFIFFYYTAVLGLPGSLVGVALAVSLAFDAIVDPLVGSWSDNIRSAFGRRLPLMLLSVPLMPMAMGLVFNPLHGLSQMGLFAWLTATCVFVRSSISLFNVPYFALGAEMSEDYVERSSVVAFRAVAGIAAGVLVTVLAFALFFVGKQGLQRAGAYPEFGWTIGLLVGLASILCVAGLRRYAPSLPQARTVLAPIWRRLPGEIAEIFRNRSFRMLFVSAVIFYVAVGLNGTLATHANVFVWKLPAVLIQFLGYSLLIGVLIGISLSPWVARRLEKKMLVLIGLAVIAVVWTALPSLRALHIITMTGAAALWPLVINALVGGVGVGLTAVSYPSMMADAADEHEFLYGTRREGLYFSGLSFAAKAATGLGVLVAGFALDLIGFPRDVSHIAHNTISQGALSRLMLVHGPGAAMISLIAMAIFAPYGISRLRQSEIFGVLAQRRAEALASSRADV